MTKTLGGSSTSNCWWITTRAVGGSSKNLLSHPSFVSHKPIHKMSFYLWQEVYNQAWSVFQFSPSSRPGDVLVRSVTVVVAVEHFHILRCFRILIEFTMKSTTLLPTYEHVSVKLLIFSSVDDCLCREWSYGIFMKWRFKMKWWPDAWRSQKRFHRLGISQILSKLWAGRLPVCCLYSPLHKYTNTDSLSLRDIIC